MGKKKLSPLGRVKLMLAVEYGIFVLVFLALGVLFLTGVIAVAEWKRYVFTYVTLVGGLWLIADFVWTLASKKRRLRQSFLDKCLLLPVGLSLVGFDIYAITQGCADTLPYRYVIGVNFCVLAGIYLFQTIFHYFFPIPAAFEAVAELEAEEAKKAAEPAEQTPILPPEDESKED
ncbi:MAG: hypothetical protein K6E59_03835 [Bacilli bacterium]|nr:hypothetical protein [Bacilli bacterium]